MPSTVKAILDKHGNSIDKQCIFPFIYKNKLVKKCVPNQKKGAWCATKVNKKREMVEYGICESNLQKTKKIVSRSPGIVNDANIRANNQNLSNNKTQKNNKKSVSVRTKRIKKHNVDDLQDELDRDNAQPLVIPESMIKYVRPIEDKLKIKLWETPTRVNFLNWFDDNFKKYRVKRTRETAMVACDDDKDCNVVPKKKKMELFKHQKIVRDYVNLESPYRGIIVFHGLGVGKTCSSIAIAEGFKSARKIVVMLQKSIKQNYITQLKECGDLYFRHDNHWEFIRTTTQEKINVALKLGIPSKVIKREGGCFLIDFTKPSNYDSLSGMMKKRLEEQIDDMINAKYDFKHINGLTASQLDNMEINQYFDNKVVVVDEVHNIINGMASEGSMRAKRLNQLFMAAQNVKFVFLSGTPMKNNPFEIAKLFNILRGPIQVNELRINSSMKTGGKVDYNKLEKLLQKNQLLDQVMIQPKTKIIKLTRNPIGFIRSKDNRGLLKSELNTIPHQNFIEAIELYLVEHGYQVKGINTYDTILFPDTNKDFMKRFYNTATESIIDQETFRRRILGMTSYYSSVDASLVPEIRTKETIKVPMSDYMFDKYSMIRKTEIDRDKKSKSGKKGKDDLFGVNSSYRAYSRMLCQFVFPEEIERPFKGDMKDLEVREEDLDKKILLEQEYDEKINAEKSREKIIALKEELKSKILELKNISQEYEQRLQNALKQLDENRDMYLQYDNGNKKMLAKYSPKYAKMLSQVLRDRDSKKKGLKFIYTEYKTCEGVGILSIVLRANGYSPFRVKKDVSGEWELDFIKGEEHLPKFAVWSGDEESDIILNIYNDHLDKLPEKIQRQVRKISDTNKHGELLEILMTTKQGAEGLNTRHVRQLHVVEPYWNPVRLDQVIGRAVRINSHVELLPAERNVDIYIYLSKATLPQLKKNVTMMNDFKGKTSDEVLYDIAERKRRIMNVMLGMMKDSAIDCSINLGDNKKDDSKIKCIHLSGKDNNSYSHPPNLDDELKQQERARRSKTEAQTYKTILVKRGPQKMKVAVKNDTLYDYDAVESGRPGRPIGEITVDGKGKRKVKFY